MDVSSGSVGTSFADGDTRDPSGMMEKLQDMRHQVMCHPVYNAIDPDSLPHFMEHHVFAVLDFMWLLKSLQVSLTNTEVAWIPQGDPTARRFVNEIVLGEESDTIADRHVSHFDLYIEAMGEAGADTEPILACVDAIRAGEPVPVALKSCAGPSAAVEFSLATWELASTGGLHERVAAFAFGREEVIPEMFGQILDSRDGTHSFPTFETYLERHIEVDGDVHGPLALELVRASCGTDPGRWQETEEAATVALDNRSRLWDAALAAIADGHAANAAAARVN